MRDGSNSTEATRTIHLISASYVQNGKPRDRVAEGCEWLHSGPCVSLVCQS